jgi:hypothetical protein
MATRSKYEYKVMTAITDTDTAINTVPCMTSACNFEWKQTCNLAMS